MHNLKPEKRDSKQHVHEVSSIASQQHLAALCVDATPEQTGVSSDILSFKHLILESAPHSLPKDSA